MQSTKMDETPYSSLSEISNSNSTKSSTDPMIEENITQNQEKTEENLNVNLDIGSITTTELPQLSNEISKSITTSATTLSSERNVSSSEGSTTEFPILENNSKESTSKRPVVIPINGTITAITNETKFGSKTPDTAKKMDNSFPILTSISSDKLGLEATTKEPVINDTTLKNETANIVSDKNENYTSSISTTSSSDKATTVAVSNNKSTSTTEYSGSISETKMVTPTITDAAEIESTSPTTKPIILTTSTNTIIDSNTNLKRIPSTYILTLAESTTEMNKKEMETTSMSSISLTISNDVSSVPSKTTMGGLENMSIHKESIETSKRSEIESTSLTTKPIILTTSTKADSNTNFNRIPSTYILTVAESTTEMNKKETETTSMSSISSTISNDVSSVPSKTTMDGLENMSIHKESIETSKRSIGSSKNNDLTSSSYMNSTNKEGTDSNILTTTDKIEQITLKHIETTLETPVNNSSDTSLSTEPTLSVITDEINTTSEKQFTAEPITTLKTITQKEVIATTPSLSIINTTSQENLNHSTDNNQQTIVSLPVFSAGDTIVKGHTINEISNDEKKKEETKKSVKAQIELCTSTECVHSASKMLSRMNLEIDPCDDFYEFACGTFLEETHVPSEKSNVDIFSTINDKLQQQIQVLLSEPIDENKDIIPVKVVKTLFNACMNKDLIEERGEKPLIDLLHLLGGWPILIGDSWSGEHWTWTYTVARMKLLGVGIDYILELSVMNDFANSSKRIIYLDQASTELDREFLIKGWNSTNVIAYFEYIRDISIALGANKEVADREAREIVNFEISLGQVCKFFYSMKIIIKCYLFYKISASKESRRELHQLYNPITIRELQHQHSYINWLEYINLLLPHKARVNDQQIISLADKTFFKKLGPLLDNTPKKVIANYLLWHAVDASIGYLTDKLQKIELRYRSKTNGKDELDPLWKECVISIAPRFKMAIGAKYAREYFKEDSKKVAIEMVNDIKEAFSEIIQTRDWMDEDTKIAAMEKLSRMSVNIAYPNELMDDTIVTEYYKGLHVKQDEYFESALRSYSFLLDKGLERLHESVNKTDWRDLSYVAVVNAFYHPLLNYIMFPAGILQDHFFQANRPKYMNYAAIGFVIGHEITHGFDDMGAQFDVEGNLRQWWQNETLHAYTTRAQCIIDQYSNFTDPEVNVTLNGFNTQGENIADNGGLKEAYNAYQKWVEKYGVEPGLPGLNYTSNQLFWISAAQTWCTKYKPEALKYTIITDSHSPGRFRVMGPFINSKAFANDFKCSSESKMNPQKKCEVW
uniref:CSON013010 protein n=1 Tax=Culicoides sonorensis TaxID=179676 RepID=A0A336KCR9_CULSO